MPIECNDYTDGKSAPSRSSFVLLLTLDFIMTNECYYFSLIH